MFEAYFYNFKRKESLAKHARFRVDVYTSLLFHTMRHTSDHKPYVLIVPASEPMLWSLGTRSTLLFFQEVEHMDTKLALT